mgnify:CR=1 FL=1
MRGAFVTYNTVGDGQFSSGWHKHNGHEALVLQNTKGFRWAVHENIGEVDIPPGDYSRSDDKNVGAVKSQIEALWEQLTQEIDTLDFLVIYLGSTGSERFIELAKELPAEKITFVSCDCRLGRKTELLRDEGLWGAERVLCECGGRRTMGGFLGHFMLFGELPNLEA